mmetsp:Transcript_26399/g.40868  ORF Transcript_26399/g.40868 Transcript_26399/m.40868 type:complete len:253 (-) Transcript_26399:13-771(-)
MPIRHRGTPTSNFQQQSDQQMQHMFSSSGNSIPAPSLVNASPSHHGLVYKLHIPLLWTMLPLIFQRALLWLNNRTFCGYFLARFCPSFKARYMIQLGSYLYRFRNESSTSPKGKPIILQSVEAATHINIDSDDSSMLQLSNGCVIDEFPDGCKSLFVVQTFMKTRYFVVPDYEGASAWVNSIRQGRQEAITRSFGHSHVPYPETWDYFDKRAKGLVQKMTELNDRLDQARTRDLELTSLMGERMSVPPSRFD